MASQTRIPEGMIEPLIPISEAVVPKDENLAHEEDVVHRFEPKVLVVNESIVPKAESLVPEEGIAPETKG